MSIRTQINDKIRSIPPMSRASLDLIRLLDNPDTALNDVVKRIEYDPGLTAELLRLANSAHFGFPRAVPTVREAVMRLGTKRVYHLLMASLTTPWMTPEVKGYDMPPKALWHHAMATAIAAEQIARVLDCRLPEYTFTAALLHDIGKVVLGTFVEVDVAPILELAFEEGVSFEVAEHNVLGLDHAEVGAMLLSQWELPEEIVEVVRWHHDPDSAGEDRMAVDLTHVADTVSMAGSMGIGVDGLNYEFHRSAAERLGGLGTSTLETVECNTLTALQDMLKLFADTGEPTGRK